MSASIWMMKLVLAEKLGGAQRAEVSCQETRWHVSKPFPVRPRRKGGVGGEGAQQSRYGLSTLEEVLQGGQGRRGSVHIREQGSLSPPEHGQKLVHPIKDVELGVAVGEGMGRLPGQPSVSATFSARKRRYSRLRSFDALASPLPTAATPGRGAPAC